MPDHQCGSMMIGMKKRAVFLDRDGVINRAIVRNGQPCSPVRIEETEIMPDAECALALLKRHRFLLIVVTNQPDVPRGSATRTAVESIHQFLSAKLPLDDFFVCYHDDSDNCECRKPKPGLLMDAAQTHNIDLARSYLIGDRWRDIEAGWAAGCGTIWMQQDYDRRKPCCAPDVTVSSLRQAANWILAQTSS